MKKLKIFSMAALMSTAMLTSSCGDDFLSASSTQQPDAGAAATEGTILSSLGSAYQILLFDSYANNNYNGVLLMSDLRSDDIYKGGGDAGDQSQLYSLSLFQMSPNEGLGLWNIYYTGLARCNNVIIACANPVDVSENKVKQYNAEAHFLRAYYVHLLWKLYGNIPYFEEPLTDPYMAPQLSADQVYTEIMEDLEVACEEGAMNFLNNSGSDKARACRAAALMLKARVVMYQKDTSKYAEITNDMASIIKSGELELMEDFDAMWLDENEFCKESIFESNQIPEGKTWSTGWAGYGTNLPAFISPNGLVDPSGVFKGGWGFAPVREAAYDMYEPGDLRRDASINDWRGGNYGVRFQDTGLFQRKYAAREGYNPPPGDTDLNYCNNLRLFRYAETLLNYVELVKMHGQSEAQGVDAQGCLDKIRARAFGRDASIAATAENIKMERRREFLGEGMRFYDLVRWGDAAAVLTENDAAHNSVRTYTDDKKYLPIPQGEIDKTKGTEFELKQNPGY